MFHKLIIKRTMTRQPGLYIKLLVCLTCAVMLIACMLIYKDSNAYGRQQYLYEKTRNADIAISELAETDVTRFSLSGRSHFWENGTLYITIGNTDTIDNVIGELRKTVSEQGLSCEITNNYYINRSETPELAVMILLVTFVLAMFSALSMVFMVRAFLHAREGDIRTLYRMGATFSQIQKILRTELTIVAVVALVVGILLANLMMFVVIGSYIHLENEAFATITYHYSPGSLLLTVILVVLIHGFASETGICRLKRLNFEKETLAEKRVVELKEKTLDAVYTWISLKRNRAHNLICFLVTLPILVIGIFVSSYMGMYTPDEKADKTGDIALYRNIESANEITQDTFEALFAGKEEIEQVTYFTYRTDYSLMLSDKRVELVTSGVDSDGTEITMAEYGIMEDWLIEQYCGDHFASSVCVVPMGYGLDTGDTVRLQNGTNRMELTVGGTYDTGKKDPALKMFPVYVTKDVYEKTTGEEAVPYVVSIYLSEKSSPDVLSGILTDEIHEAYSLRNNLQNQQDYGQMYSGFGYILSMMAVFICLTEAMLIFSYISLHIDEEKREIGILHKLGCKHRQIFSVYFIQYLIRYAAALFVGLVLSAVCVSWLSESLHKNVVFNIATTVPPLLIMMVLLVAYMGSVTVSVKNSLREWEG